MTVKPIAYSYWRSIQRGARAFANVPAEVQNDVKALAADDVANGTIDAGKYEELIGEPFAAE